MAFIRRFEDYIGRFQRRLQSLITARGVALLAGAALLVTIAAVAIADRAGFAADIVIIGRLVLFASLVAIAWFYIICPRQKVMAHGAQAIEARTPAFGGRVETYLGMPDRDNPLRDLLAEDALRIAREHPPESEIRARDLRITWFGAGIAAIALLVLAIAGPGNVAFGVRQLWVGWAFPGLLPPHGIEVAPGDSGIRLGGNLRIAATPRGFSAAAATVSVSFGEGSWQQVPMTENAGAFEFVFFSVREPLEYYVSANNVRSPTFEVDVVDLPIVDKLVLTYRYPGWARRESEIRDPGGDVRVIEQTEVEVAITTDRPMTPGELIVDELAIPLDVEGRSATASFVVETDGQYHVAAKVGGERIRLTDDYFITVEDDNPPTLEFARPGRDWSASRIEEVTAQVAAADDFGLESLALHYSVNGSDWRRMELEATGTKSDAEHVFFLEALGQADAGGALETGGLIAYYAIAEDRESSTRTDMFFVDVQPFDRRYSQSQAGAPAGGMQGGRPDEISQRQREIIISTWNLIREQNEQSRTDTAYVTDNAALLARLQATLKDRVESLVRRSEARRLTATDADIARFVEHLRSAADAMGPAAERLGAIDLEQALLPEQEALQHLLAAEAVFTDISISLQANNRGGQAGRDLTEMFELEMDLEKNQYETGSRASPEPPQRQIEDAADELAELARRQEQLAESRNSQQTPMPTQRWQQEMLRRDVEELRERLERMSQTSADNSSRAAGGSSAGPASGRPLQGEALHREIDELQRRLDSALRAMNQADVAMNGTVNPEDLERAMEEAQRQLEGARDRASEVQWQAMQATVADLASRAEELHETQVGLERRLQKAVREVLLGPGDPDRLDSGMTAAEEFAIATDKRLLLAELEDLQRDARSAAKDLRRDRPRAADAISEGIERLEEQRVEARIAVAAAYIEQGEGIYVASSESAVTEALHELRDRLARAEELLAGGSGLAIAGRRDELRSTLAETRRLRRNLQRLADGTLSWDLDDRIRPEPGTLDDVAIGREVERQLLGLSGDVSRLLRGLGDAGVAAHDIDELRRLAAELGAAEFSGNPELLDRESRFALTLVEQLELALGRSMRRDDGKVRANTDEEIPAAYRNIVADYYRRLGSVDEED